MTIKRLKFAEAWELIKESIEDNDNLPEEEKEKLLKEIRTNHTQREIIDMAMHKLYETDEFFI